MNKKQIKLNPKYESLFHSKCRYHVVMGGRSCFDGDTLVITNKGSIKIKDISIGDTVYCYNETLRVNELKSVKDLFKYKIDEQLIKVDLKNGSHVVATKDHMFYSDGEWVSLYNLVSLWHERNMETNTELQRLSSKQSGERKDKQLERLWKDCNDEASKGQVRLPKNHDEGRLWRDKDSENTQDSLFSVSRSSRKTVDCPSQEQCKGRQSTREFRVDDSLRQYDGVCERRMLGSCKGGANWELCSEGKGCSGDKEKVRSISVHKENASTGLRCDNSYDQGCSIPSQLELVDIVGYSLVDDVDNVYDISILDNHNYYLDLGKPVLVHNSGKSFGVALFLVLMLKFEAGHKVLYTRYTMSSAEKSIIPEFIDKIKLLGLEDEFIVTKKDIVHRNSGSSIFFSGIKTSSGDQTASLKSLHGVTTLIVEEAEELMEEDVFDKIDLSVRVKGVQNRVILIMNPATKTHWIYERFFEQAGVSDDFIGENGGNNYILTTYLDNIDNIDSTFVKRAQLMKEKQPEKYNHVFLGAWLPKAEGVIFQYKISGFEYIEGSTYYGQDYGFSVDPTTLIKVSIDRLRKRIYCKEMFYEEGLTTSQIAIKNFRHTGGETIYVDNSEPRLIAELKEKGMNVVPTIKGQGSLLAGIKIMQDFEIFVDPNSKNLIKEFNNYTWKKGSDKEPIDAWNHGIDSIRYVTFNTHRERKRSIFSG